MGGRNNCQVRKCSPDPEPPATIRDSGYGSATAAKQPKQIATSLSRTRTLGVTARNAYVAGTSTTAVSLEMNASPRAAPAPYSDDRRPSAANFASNHSATTEKNAIGPSSSACRLTKTR